MCITYVEGYVLCAHVVYAREHCADRHTPGHIKTRERFKFIGMCPTCRAEGMKVADLRDVEAERLGLDQKHGLKSIGRWRGRHNQHQQRDQKANGRKRGDGCTVM